MSYSTENNILLHLTGKQNAGDITVDELKAIADKYPAFGVAKFLLAKKAFQQQHTDAAAFAQNAILHFTNPYWFHFKLNEESLMKDEAILAEMKPGALVTEATAPAPEAEPAPALTENQPAPAREATDEYSRVETAVGEELDQLQPGIEDKIIAARRPAQAEADEIIPAVSLEDVPVDRDDIIPAVSKEDVPIDQDDIIPAVSQEEIPVDVDDVVPAVSAEDVPVDKDDIVPAVSAEDVPLDKDDIVPALPVEEMEAVSTEIAQDEHPQETTPTPISEENVGHSAGDAEEQFEDADAENEANIGAPVFSDKISSVLQEQLQEFKKPVADDTPVPIETEPYHTVDYFASQGIKLSLDTQKQDNLGVKVKKFTDWLKQMKRVSPAPGDLGTDEAAENKVQDIAATSNQTKDVVTEAMAEVLAMQGMKEKAIQVYAKLSFLDPSKTAYFASKIEKLKGL